MSSCLPCARCHFYFVWPEFFHQPSVQFPSHPQAFLETRRWNFYFLLSSSPHGVSLTYGIHHTNPSERPAVEVTSVDITMLHYSCHPSRLEIPVPWETTKLGGLAQAMCPSRVAARIFGRVLSFIPHRPATNLLTLGMDGCPMGNPRMLRSALIQGAATEVAGR